MHRPTDVPRWVYLPAAAGAIFVVLPLVAIALKVDWPHFWSLITSPSSQTALLLSLKTAAASTALCVLLGVPMALVLARSTARLVRVLRPLILLPLVLPPVVGGIALLYAFGRLGLIGRYLDAAGISIAFSTTAVVLAQTFVSLPFLVISLEGAARTAGSDFEVVAATLGARPSTVWWRVTLPLLLPGLASGCRAGVRPLAGGVRRDADVRRVPPGRDPDPAAGDLPAAGDRPRRGGGTVAPAGGGGGGGGAGSGHPPADRDGRAVATRLITKCSYGLL